jgi:hypothetical protein
VVSAAYWVLIADELMTAGMVLPPGLRLAGPPVLPTGPVLPVQPQPVVQLPGAHWHLFEDDGAPPELNGRRIELILRLEAGHPVLAERRVVGCAPLP